jgi:hypothetical protein
MHRRRWWSRRNGGSAAAGPRRRRGHRAGEARGLPSRLSRRHRASLNAATARRARPVRAVRRAAAHQAHRMGVGPARWPQGPGDRLHPAAATSSLHRDDPAMGSARSARRGGHEGADLHPSDEPRRHRPAVRAGPRDRCALRKPRRARGIACRPDDRLRRALVAVPARGRARPA